jgi:hypothetical protein
MKFQGVGLGARRTSPFTSPKYTDEIHFVIFEVFTAMLVVWVVGPCGLFAVYQHFGGTYYLHLQGKPIILKFG